MKTNLAAVAVLAAGLASGASAALFDFHRATLDLPQAVKLGDGSVLSKGKYDVQISYRGFGNAAEFLFFQGGVLKGKTPAEARGFPTQAPPATTARKAGEDQKEYLKYDSAQKGVKLDQTGQKADVKLDGIKGESQDDKHKGDIEASPGFSWGAHGFPAGIAGKTAPVGQSLKLSFDSTNSAAGFAATLPVAGKK